MRDAPSSRSASSVAAGGQTATFVIMRRSASLFLVVELQTVLDCWRLLPGQHNRSLCHAVALPGRRLARARRPPPDGDRPARRGGGARASPASGARPTSPGSCPGHRPGSGCTPVSRSRRRLWARWREPRRVGSGEQRHRPCGLLAVAVLLPLRPRDSGGGQFSDGVSRALHRLPSPCSGRSLLTDHARAGETPRRYRSCQDPCASDGGRRAA
jgi:hypothetical protein